MSERSVALPTTDHGDVTLPEPSWCAGHDHHDPETARVDLMHCGPTVECGFLGRPLLAAELVQSPYATPGTPRLGGPTPGVSVQPLGLTLSPAELYDLAAALDGFADRLRGLADQLDALTAGGAQ